jgi:hypothetical protein
MKKYLFIVVCTLYSVFCIPLTAQIVQPVKWSGEQVGDSVRLTAVFEEGWHMTLISVGDEEIGEEIYESPYTLTLAKAEPIRFNACDDNMCTAPETWTFQGKVQSDNVQGTKEKGFDPVIAEKIKALPTPRAVFPNVTARVQG